MAPYTIQHQVALDRLNTLGLQARAERYCKITSAEALAALRASPDWGDGPALVLGGGSNIVLRGDVAGLTLHIAVAGLRMTRHAAYLEIDAGAGLNWDRLVRDLIEQGEGGLENLVAIPGSVGAAPVQNIGAYGLELAQRIAQVTAFERSTGRTEQLALPACRFGYRDSVFKQQPTRYIILEVQLHLPRPWLPVLEYADLALLPHGERTPGGIAACVARLRRLKLPDPAAIGNVGSFFKNPVVDNATYAALRSAEPGIVGYPQGAGEGTKLAAAWLIERAGFKGLVKGNAAVHDRQALVLVNRGGASAAEILDLAATIRQGVQQRFGVVLEQEPVLV